MLGHPEYLVSAGVESFTEFTGCKIVQVLLSLLQNGKTQQDLDRHPKSEWRHCAFNKSGKEETHQALYLPGEHAQMKSSFTCGK